MIAPELPRGGNGETGRWVLLRNNLLVAALIFLVLEIWRPCYFLTDDNLDGGMPFFSEVGRKLLAGQWPFVGDYIFGGHYNFLRDPTYFCWHPLYLLVSLLSGTPLRWLMIDIDAFVLVMLATAGFVVVAGSLRREMRLSVSDGWLMFYTMSFTYSMIVLTTGASWLNFLGNQSALPWLAWGILQRSAWRGAAIVAIFALHQLLAGHPEPTISSTIFLSLFAVGIGAVRRSWVPVLAWGFGYAAALLIVLPLLIPALGGFLAGVRSHGVDLNGMTENNIPLLEFPTSLFLGMALWFIHPPAANFHETYTMAVGSCAAAWCLLPALAGRTRWSPLERMLFGLLVIIGLFIARPLWISQLMLQVPLLKSMRWPFREFIQFQFFLHLFLLIRRPGFTPRWRLLAAVLGVLLFVPPLFIHQPPTFARMELDRQLLFTGAFDRYWEKVRTLLRPDDRIAVIIPPELYLNDDLDKPYSLLGTYNYPCLAHVINVWGWSQTPPQDQYTIRTLPLYVFGAYTPEQRAALVAENPAQRFITLESLQPLKITLSSATGPAIDLTPFAPPLLGAK